MWIDDLCFSFRVPEAHSQWLTPLSYAMLLFGFCYWDCYCLKLFVAKPCTGGYNCSNILHSCVIYKISVKDEWESKHRREFLCWQISSEFLILNVYFSLRSIWEAVGSESTGVCCMLVVMQCNVLIPQDNGIPHYLRHTMCFVSVWSRLNSL